MNFSTRQKLASGAVYTVLAVIIVAVIAAAVIGIMSSTSNKESVPPQDIVTASDSQSPEEISSDNILDTSAQDIASETSAAETEPVAVIETEAAAEVIAEESEPVKQADADPYPVNPIPTSVPENFSLPCIGSISKDYSEEALVYSLTMNDYRVHLGVDFASSVGAPVMACADGVIRSIYDDPFMGTTMIIEHGGGVRSYYMNLSPDFPQGVSAGAAVTAGQTIAGVGETSLSETADTIHLHFEMTVGGEHINPAEYIPYDSIATVSYEDNSAE